MQRKRSARILIAFLLLVMTGFIGYKVLFIRYTLTDIVPQDSYTIELSMTFTGNGDDLVVRTFLPRETQTQRISAELVNAPDLTFHKETASLFTRGEWSRYLAKGPYRITYSFDAQIQPVEYSIDPDLRIPSSTPDALKKYVSATGVIQLEDPVIVQISREVTDSYFLPTLKAIYDYVYALSPKPFKGTTDAVTAAKLGEASCNGKSRLFVALARRAGIPARLIGGIILTPGSKRTSHQWVEAYVEGHWIPFDALNGHFASLPGNYLTLYRGDESLFVHSRNIGFDYRFTIKKRLVSNDRLAGFLGGHAFNLYKTLQTFTRVNVSINILKFLLVIPLGVLVVVVSRNIIGITTFGTFLPALMAMAIRETGLIPGMIAFVFVIGLTMLIRSPLDRLGILHTPKLAIMMIVAIGALLGLTVLSDILRIDALSSIGAAALFPIAIMTITAERVAITLSEEGMAATLITMGQTLVVMSICYLIMNSLAVQALMLAFPELLLGVIALNIWIGTWTGLRVTEMVRFRLLYTEERSESGDR